VTKFICLTCFRQPSADTDVKQPVPTGRPLRKCPIYGQLRDSKNYTGHVKAHKRYTEGTVARGRPPVKKFNPPSVAARAGCLSVQPHTSDQSWAIRRAARKMYSYLCISAQVSTLREIAKSEISALPDSTADAVITMGQAVMREVKLQFGAVSPQVISRAASKFKRP